MHEASRAGWLVTVELHGVGEAERPQGELGPGESAAILLAEQEGPVPLLIHEKRGRAAARSRSLPVLGTGGVLLAAKGKGLLSSVRSALDLLSQAGYRLSPRLRARLLELAGEAEGADPGAAG